MLVLQPLLETVDLADASERRIYLMPTNYPKVLASPWHGVEPDPWHGVEPDPWHGVEPDPWHGVEPDPWHGVEPDPWHTSE